MISDSTMGLNTDGEEMSPGSTVPDGLEPTEKACESEQQPENKKKIPEEVVCDTRIQDQKLFEGTGIQPFFPLHNLSRLDKSDILNFDHSEAKEQERNARYRGGSPISALSQRPDSDRVDDTSEARQSTLVAGNTDTPVDLEESLSPSSEEIMELFDTKKNDDWDAMHKTLQEEAALCESDLIKQDLPINPDVDLIDEEGYTPLYKEALKGHLERLDDLISHGANPDKPSKGGLTPLHAAAQEGHEDIVDYLILQGADVNVECEMGRTPLHTAAEKGYTDIMKSFLAEGTDVNRKDKTGWTPFNTAVSKGHLESVRYIIIKGAKQNRYDGMTPLYLAAQSGHFDTVKFLISNGADVNEGNDSGRIPLHGAAINGHIEDMEYLIQQGSDVNKGDLKGWTPFNAAVQYGHLEAVKYLIAKGAKQNRYDGMTPLYAVSRFGHLDLVKFFISKGADVNEENDKGMIPLHGAAIQGNTEVVKYLIEQRSDVNKGDVDGWTTFNAAVEHGHLEVVKCLISKGSLQNRDDGMTPLYAAAQFGHLNLVEFFISEGADVNEEDDEGMIPLHSAASGGHMDVLKFLVQQGSDVNKGDVDGWTPFNAAVEHGHLEAVKYLIAKGAWQNRDDGMTPLFAAAQFGYLDLVKFFISKGADVNEENEEGMIPLHATSFNGHSDVLEYLVQQGSDVNKSDYTGRSPLFAAVRNGHLEAVKLLVANGAQCINIRGMTPLYIATQYGHVDVAKHLVSVGYNVNNRNEFGRSPLHAACYNGDMDAVKYLVGHNANVNEQDQDGWTPLHAAAQEGHREVVEFLTLFGADITAKDIEGMTPLQVAKNRGQAKVLKYLTHLRDDTINEDTSYPRYEIYLGDTQRHHSEGKTHIKYPAKRFDPKASSDVTNVDSMDGYSLVDANEDDIDAVHNEYLPTMHPLGANGERDESNPFVSAMLKYPKKTAITAEQEQVNGSMPVERESRAGQDPTRNICHASDNRSAHGVTNSTDHNAFALPNQSPTWNRGGSDQSSLHATEETEHRFHVISEVPFSLTIARNDQPTTENEEKFDRPILTNPLAEDRYESNEGNPVSTKRSSTHSGWKTKEKHRSVDSPCSSLLVLVHSLLHMIIALSIILAGSPVLVAGSTRNERVTLQAGENSVIPFNLTWLPNGKPHFNLYFTLRFDSKDRPFCFNGYLDVDGFKSPSQLPRFTTAVEELVTSFFLNLFIETVNSLDGDMYVLTVLLNDFHDVWQETLKKEVLVQIPPGPANCFMSLSDNNNYPYEAHCHAISGSVETTLTCYQNSQRLDIKGDITDNGQVTRGVFLPPDNSRFSCCSHGVDSVVTEPMCNDFEWLPSRKITTQSASLTYSSRPVNQRIETTHTLQVESRACRQCMYWFVWWVMYLLIYLFAFVAL